MDDGARRELARLDGLDDLAATVDDVADRPDAPVGGTSGGRVRRRGALAQRDAEPVHEPGHRGGALLADGPDDEVQGDLQLRAVDRHGSTPPGRVRLAQRHALEQHPRHVAGAQDLDRGGEPAHGDAQGAREVDGVRVRRALLGAAAVEQGDLGGAQADRGRRRVERRAAAADDADPPAGEGIAGLAVDRAPDELQRVDDPLPVLAGDAEALAVPQAHRDDHRVVAREERLRLHVPPDGGAEHEPRTGALDLRDLQLHGLAREAPRDDAVVAEPARAGLRVVDRHRHARTPQLRGAGQAGRAGADDRDADARVRARREEVIPGGRVGLHRVPLQPPDGDGRVERGAHAGTLAQALHRARRAAGRPQRVGGQDRPRASLEVAGRDLADERRARRCPWGRRACTPRRGSTGSARPRCGPCPRSSAAAGGRARGGARRTR